MSIYGRQAYLETEISEAEPLQLIRLLYKGAIEAVGQARNHVREGRISERSRQITRVMEIISELDAALNLEQGGSVAANLSRLYDYMNQRLQDANFQQIEPPLIEVEGLLTTLAEAWNQCEQASSATAGAVSAGSEAGASSSHLWSNDDAYVGYSPQTLGRY